jgi:hypothetical protein
MPTTFPSMSYLPTLLAQQCSNRQVRVDESNTMFALMEFRKLAAGDKPRKSTPAKGKAGQTTGGPLLKPCIYKRR